MKLGVAADFTSDFAALNRMKSATVTLIIFVLGFVPPQGTLAQQSAPAKGQSQAGVAVARSAPMGVQVNDTKYVIGARDILSIVVWEQASLSCPTCLVRPDGNITVPLINEIRAAGLTPDDLRRDLAVRFAAIIRDPQVSVQVAQVNSKKYFVQGEVNKPGEVDLVAPTTIMEGLAAAAGFRDFADQKNIIIVRGPQRLRFNYKDVVKGKNLEQNIYLEPGDIIIVK